MKTSPVQMTEASVLALDVGSARVGVAMTSLAARLPRPLVTLKNDGDFWENLTRLAGVNNAAAIVIGLPRSLSGTETAQTKATRLFAAELETKLNLPIYWQDETLTSVKAEKELVSKNPRKGVDIDSLAATYILEDFLMEHKDLHENL